MTQHFNNLSESEQERLAILLEECSEVIQAGCKILRHGYESKNPKIENSETNRQALERELGDLTHSMARMIEAKDIDGRFIEERANSKGEHVRKYLHHQ